MNIFGRHHHGCDDPWENARPHEIELREMLGVVLKNQETIMIDTARILAAVAKEKTEVASLRALLDAKDKIIADGAAALKAAIDAGGDPNALAKVQADLDQAAADLETDSAATEDAIAANTPAASA